MATDITIWEYNGLQLELDIQDIETMKRYDTAFATMAVHEKAIKKTGKTYEIMDAYVQMFWDLFDDLFGAGTSEKLFDGRRSGTKCTNAYDSFLDFVSAQKESFQSRTERMKQRYSPNRAQRRAQK